MIGTKERDRHSRTAHKKGQFSLHYFFVIGTLLGWLTEEEI